MPFEPSKRDTGPHQYHFCDLVLIESKDEAEKILKDTGQDFDPDKLGVDFFIKQGRFPDVDWITVVKKDIARKYTGFGISLTCPVNDPNNNELENDIRVGGHVYARWTTVGKAAGIDFHLYSADSPIRHCPKNHYRADNPWHNYPIIPVDTTLKNSDFALANRAAMEIHKDTLQPG